MFANVFFSIRSLLWNAEDDYGYVVMQRHLNWRLVKDEKRTNWFAIEVARKLESMPHNAQRKRKEHGKISLKKS